MAWYSKALVDVCESIFAGGDVPKDRISKVQNEQYSVPIYANGEKDKGLYGFTDIPRVTSPSMTVSARGTIGYSEIRYEPFLPVVRLIVLTPKSDLISLEFLKYALKGMDFKNSGTSIPQLTVPMIKNYKIDLPDLAEQKRIVAILDQVFADIDKARATAETNLKNARELFDSYLQQVFSQRGEGWGTYKLSNLCELVSGQHIDAKDYNAEQNGIGYLTGPSDFGQINPIVTKWTEHPKRTAIKGDILITVKGSGVGKINVMDDQELAISRQLMAIRPTIAKGEVLYWFVSTQYKYFQSLANGAAIPGISRGDVLDLQLCLPDIKGQEILAKEISEFNSNASALRKVYENKIIALIELKKSILQKAFTGELIKSKGIAA